MGSRNFYEALGVARDADADEIRRAYRELARRHHPDAHPEEGAEERFKEISEAYAVLSNPEERARYDALERGRAPRPAPAAASGAPAGVRIEVDLDTRLPEITRDLGGLLGRLFRKVGRDVLATSSTDSDEETRRKRGAG